MANDIARYKTSIIKIIKEHNICFLEHIFSHYALLGRSRFYELKLNKSDEILDAIASNREKTVHTLLNKWVVSDKPLLQIAAMRMVCTPEQHRTLNQTFIEHHADTNIKPLSFTIIDRNNHIPPPHANS